MAVERQPLHLGELAQHSLAHQPPEHGRGALHGRGDLGHGGWPAHGREVFDHLPARGRAAGGGEVGGEPSRGQLDRVHVAGGAGTVGFAADPPVLCEDGQDLLQIRQAGAGLELGDAHPAPLAQGLDDRPLGRAAGEGQGPGIREPDLAVPPRRQVSREHGADDLAQGGQIVVGDEPGQLQEIGGEHRLAIEDLLQGAQRHPFGPAVVDSHDHPGEPAPAHRHPRPHPGHGLRGPG